MKNLRGLVTKLVIGSFSTAALLGIAALLLGDDIGGTEVKILLTTVTVGIESVAMLCYLSLAGRPTAWVGAVGAGISIVPFTMALWLTWTDLFDGDLWPMLGTGITVAASLAQVCLLLAYVARPRVGPALLATFAAIAVVGVTIVVAIWGGDGLDDTYWRIFGTVAILDVLGTVVLSALAAFGRERGHDEANLLTAAVESRVVEAAAERGISPSDLVGQALDDYLR